MSVLKEELSQDRISLNTTPALALFFRLIPTRNIAFVIAAMAIMSLIPGLGLLAFLLGLLLFVFHLLTPVKLPLYMPKSSGQLDPKQIKPGSEKTLEKAQGITLYGSERGSDRHVYGTNDTDRQHLFYLATTGSGKTVGLSGFAFNSLVQGSGAIYIDGKGDVTLPVEILSMARRLGREDDVLILNFKSDGTEIYGKQREVKSNTLNQFRSGSASVIAELLKSLLSDTSEGKGGDMWLQRAQTFLESFTRCLVYARDHDIYEVNINTYREKMELEGVVEVLDDQRIPERIKRGMRAYLRTFANAAIIDKIRNGQSGQEINTARDQHGYITMQINPMLQILADDYGYIFNRDTPDIDMMDVILNRRILIVLLPALEKAPAAMAAMGKIILAQIKGMMGVTLGQQITGDTHDIIDSRQSKSDTPFRVICDEVGYYAVEGMEIAAAQARSLGISMIYATQDYPSLERAGTRVAASTWGNTNTKIIGRLEDSDKSLQMVQSRVGEGHYAELTSMTVDRDGAINRVYDGESLAISRRSRISIRDLAKLREGQAFLIHMDHVIPINMLGVFPARIKHAYLNTFLPVHADAKKIKMTQDQVTGVMQSIAKVAKLSGDLHDPALPIELELASQFFEMFPKARGFDAAIASIQFVSEMLAEANFAEIDMYSPAPASEKAEARESTPPPKKYKIPTLPDDEDTPLAQNQKPEEPDSNESEPEPEPDTSKDQKTPPTGFRRLNLDLDDDDLYEAVSAQAQAFDANEEHPKDNEASNQGDEIQEVQETPSRAPRVTINPEEIEAAILRAASQLDDANSNTEEIIEPLQAAIAHPKKPTPSDNIGETLKYLNLFLKED